MLRFIYRRFLFIALVSVFIVFSVNLGMRLTRNSELASDRVDLVQEGQLSWSDTKTFFSRAWRGDFGSVETEFGSVQVSDFLREAYLNSMGLLLVALAGSAIVGLYLGSVAALSKRVPMALPLLTLTVVGVSTPSFFGALLLQQGAIKLTNEFGRRLVSVAGFGWDYEHMLLPVLVLSARPLAYLTRATFVSLTGIMEKEFIRTAYSKGLSQRGAVWVHALRNIAVPVLTAIGVSLRFSLSTLPVVEFFFAWPGLGLRLIEAINARQTALVVVLAFALGLTFQITNLLLDLSYRLIDPRLRASE